MSIIYNFEKYSEKEGFSNSESQENYLLNQGKEVLSDLVYRFMFEVSPTYHLFDLWHFRVSEQIRGYFENKTQEKWGRLMLELEKFAADARVESGLHPDPSKDKVRAVEL